MCGLIFCFGNVAKYKEALIEARRLLRHRGPDDSGMFSNENVMMIFERLAIVGPETRQPIYNDNIVTMTNGEYYEFKSVYKNFPSYKNISNCDSEVLIPLYRAYGKQLFKHIDSEMFAGVLYDEKNNSFIFARDRIGVIPLYYGIDEEGTIIAASELKVLEHLNIDYKVFPPGHICTGNITEKNIEPYYDYEWNARNEPDLIKLRTLLTHAVEKRLECDVKYAALLSGGLDSSLVASIASRHLAKSGKKLATFSVGFKDSPDLIAARAVSKFLGTDHHEIIIDINEALMAIPEVIYHLETYDITTIRAATPMYLMARKIKAYGYKMVLSGEGADELFGGYAYFKYAPDAKQMNDELVYKVRNLYKYDCLRANKALMAWGVEGRFPFLDTEFIEYVMSIDPAAKMGIPEKRILREAFDVQYFNTYLPNDILWRSKEQFSDGVGSSWIDTLKKLVEIQVPNVVFSEYFKYNTPWNKEGFYYRAIFQKKYKSDSACMTVVNEKSIACSSEFALKWRDEWQNQCDPSGKITGHYTSLS